MKEQSQIDEMRAAIRGDRERSREHRRPSADAPPRGPDPAEEPRRSLLASLFRRRS